MPQRNRALCPSEGLPQLEGLQVWVYHCHESESGVRSPVRCSRWPAPGQHFPQLRMVVSTAASPSNVSHAGVRVLLAHVVWVLSSFCRCWCACSGYTVAYGRPASCDHQRICCNTLLLELYPVFEVTFHQHSRIHGQPNPTSISVNATRTSPWLEVRCDRLVTTMHSRISRQPIVLMWHVSLFVPM